MKTRVPLARRHRYTERAQRSRKNDKVTVYLRKDDAGGSAAFERRERFCDIYRKDTRKCALSARRAGKQPLRTASAPARTLHLRFGAFLLSLKGAKLYDLDSVPVRTCRWTELGQMREYYEFFRLHSEEFER